MAMQPTDTTLTRMYNQPTVIGPDGKLRGTLYKNPIDCLWKTAKIEGIRGLYKGRYLFPIDRLELISSYSEGSTAHFLRIAPHTWVKQLQSRLFA